MGWRAPECSGTSRWLKPLTYWVTKNTLTKGIQTNKLLKFTKKKKQLNYDRVSLARHNIRIVNSPDIYKIRISHLCPIGSKKEVFSAGTFSGE